MALLHASFHEELLSKTLKIARLEVFRQALHVGKTERLKGLLVEMGRQEAMASLRAVPTWRFRTGKRMAMSTDLDSSRANTSSYPTIRICRLYPERDADLPIPRYMTSHASGMDICCALEGEVQLETGAVGIIPTGIALSIPEDFEIQVRPRSGLAFTHGIGIINSPGTIDADYRGEIRIGMINWGDKPYTIRRGDRIAQLVLQKIYRARFEIVETLDETLRNDGGFGHTGN